MRLNKNVLALGAVFALLLFLCLPTSSYAVTGDCDGDNDADINDWSYLLSYIYGTGDPPDDPEECNCDGFPGINLGDIMQLWWHVKYSTDLYDTYGYDYVVPSLVKLRFNKKIDGSAGSNTVPIYIDVPDDIDIADFIIPLSFKAGTGEADLQYDSVSFANSFINGSFSRLYDNDDDYVVLTSYGPSIIISGGTSGLMCTIYFSQNSSGDKHALILTATDRMQLTLLAQSVYDGDDGERFILPQIIRAAYGDVNCDGVVNISDAVVIINYIYYGGDPPGSCEP